MLQAAGFTSLPLSYSVWSQVSKRCLGNLASVIDLGRRILRFFLAGKLDRWLEFRYMMKMELRLSNCEIALIRGPEAVLQVSDLLRYKGACSDQGVSILLVFLSSQLIVKRNLVIPESSSCTL
ncbi:hypothetical protein Tco_0876373 [Tanacetum coccineum]|uniref:Uncharacterized protein n=1 Tax=Tanacetum coccineum TaxID=301880 RepID=A0ABQ5BV23_9ASTR